MLTKLAGEQAKLAGLLTMKIKKAKNCANSMKYIYSLLSDIPVDTTTGVRKTGRGAGWVVNLENKEDIAVDVTGADKTGRVVDTENKAVDLRSCVNPMKYNKLTAIRY